VDASAHRKALLQVTPFGVHDLIRMNLMLMTTCMEKIAMQTNYVRTCCSLILMDLWRGLSDARA
jgi:hypothetical protein